MSYTDDEREGLRARDAALTPRVKRRPWVAHDELESGPLASSAGPWTGPPQDDGGRRKRAPTLEELDRGEVDRG